MSIKIYAIMVVLIILSSLFWIYFAITPNKKKRNIYFITLVILFFSTFVYYYKPSIYSSKTSESAVSSSTTQSSTVNLEIQTASSFETDSKGIATITGQTTPKAQIQITANTMKNPVVADEKGNFSITYTLTDPEQKKITLTATLKSKSVTKEVTIVPSSTFVSTEQSATKTSSTQSNN